MNSLVVYYSHHGNTAYVIHKLLAALNELGKTRLAKLDYKKGKKSLYKRILFKLIPRMVELTPVPNNLKEYDLLCLGVPVLAGSPSSCVSKYISICKNIKKKIIICCYVYGFQANVKKCSHLVRNAFEKKGKPRIIEIFVPWINIHKEEELDKIIGRGIDELKSLILASSGENQPVG